MQPAPPPPRLARLAPAAAIALAMVTLVVVIRFGAFVAAGADAYGYVSQADLWARGHLRVAQPIVLQWPKSVTDEMVAPLGYRPAHKVGLPGAIVPTYPPGLPMLMAVAKRLAGPRAVFLVVPLLAALAVWLAYVAGCRLAGPLAGVLAALLLVSSPAFLGGALRPMSDLPAATWWTLALIAATGGGGVGRATLAGLATSLAILTRPNLAPLALVVAAPFLGAAWRAWAPAVPQNAKIQDLTPRLAAFAITAALGPLAVALINWHLYGSPLESGYGRLGRIFEAEHIRTNLGRYTTWLLQTQTPMVLLAFLPTPGRARRFAWLCRALVLATVALYLPYLEFEDWSYLRFLLPAYPALLALVAAALVALASRLGRRWGWVGLTIVAAALVAFGWSQAWRRGVFGWAATEQRYVTIGRLIKTTLPADAVLLAMQHSGSARYYSGRITLRYDFIEPTALDSTLNGLVAAGFRPYLLLESWEEDRFRERFAGASAWGALDWPALAEITTSATVRLYDLRDRDRARAESRP